MVGSMKLADEILANASVIPVECQEHILDGYGIHKKGY